MPPLAPPLLLATAVLLPPVETGPVLAEDAAPVALDDWLPLIEPEALAPPPPLLMLAGGGGVESPKGRCSCRKSLKYVLIVDLTSQFHVHGDGKVQNVTEANQNIHAGHMKIDVTRDISPSRV